MKTRNRCLLLLLILALAVCLCACSSKDVPDDTNTNSNTDKRIETPVTPDSLETLSADDSAPYDYSAFQGVWDDGDDGTLMVGEDTDGRMRYELSAYGIIYAAGNLQYVPEYSNVYAANEYDGKAYRCWLDGEEKLHIYSFGDFTQISSAVTVSKPEKPVNDVDCTALAGTWYLNGEKSARDWIEILSDGSWEFLTMLDGDNTPTTVNEGVITGSPQGAGYYRAVSEWYADESYDLQLVSEDSISWGERNDIYGRLPAETDGGSQ